MDSRGLFVRHIQQAVAAYEGGVERGVSNSWNATVSLPRCKPFQPFTLAYSPMLPKDRRDRQELNSLEDAKEGECFFEACFWRAG